MNITGSLFAISQFESMKKKIEADKQLEEVTIEDQEQREPKEESVPADKGMEKLPQETDRGTGSDLSELWEEDEASSMPPRRRKRRKLPESES